VLSVLPVGLLGLFELPHVLAVTAMRRRQAHQYQVRSWGVDMGRNHEPDALRKSTGNRPAVSAPGESAWDDPIIA